LRERGRGAAGRDGDRERALPVDGGEDERAELGHVDDVAEHPARLRVREDAAVQLRVVGRGDDEEVAVEVLRAVATLHEADRQVEEGGLDARRDDGHARVALMEAAHLLERDRAAAHDEAGTALEVEASHVVVLVGHSSTPPMRAPDASSFTETWRPPSETSESVHAPGPLAES